MTTQWHMCEQEAQLPGRPCDAKACQGLRNGRRNETYRLKWPSNVYFKVIKSGNNRKLVCDFLLVVYSNFCIVFEKYDMKQSNEYDHEICPRSLTVVSPERCERKKRKAPFSMTPFSFDAPSPANPREYLHRPKPYTARNYVPWATFLSLTVYG